MKNLFNLDNSAKILIKKSIIAIFVIISLTGFIYGATWVIGNVGNATDGTNANGYKITLWNEENGISDNRTDTIGVTGGSGTSNFYMIDCGLLSTPCNALDTMSLMVFDNGSGYITNLTSVVISGAINYPSYIQLMKNETISEENHLILKNQHIILKKTGKISITS